MVKEIKYGGYTATPSDYECPDGDLATAINLVPEDNGMLKEVGVPDKMFDLPFGENAEGGYIYRYVFLFIHKAESYTHYIFGEERSNDKLYLHWIDKEDLQEDNFEEILARQIIDHEFTYDDAHKISLSAIGNTLLVSGGTDERMHYLLWKDSGYKYLGDHIPEIYLSFGLKGYVDKGGEKFTNIVTADENGDLFVNNGSEEDLYEISSYGSTETNFVNAIMGYAAKLVKEYGEDRGRFVHPFFVRYAIRLYDSSLVLHSAPILMNPCTSMNPIILPTRYDIVGGGGYTTVWYDSMIVSTELNCQYLKNISEHENLENWKDIITGIDIYVTPQMCPYNINGTSFVVEEIDSNLPAALETRTGKTILGEHIANIKLNKFVGTLDELGNEETRFCQYYYDDLIRVKTDLVNQSRPFYIYKLPQLKDSQVNEQMENMGNFLMLASIPLNELDDYITRKSIKIPDTTVRTISTTPGKKGETIYSSSLTGLEGHEQMTDDYQSHDHIVPKSVFEYNNNVNYSGITRELYNGFPLASMLAYCNIRCIRDGSTFVYVPQTTDYRVAVTTKANGIEKRVVCDLDKEYPFLQRLLSYPLDISADKWSRESWANFFFYPDKNATKMEIYLKNDSLKVRFDIELRPHERLNGAYAFLNYEEVRKQTATFDGDWEEDLSPTRESVNVGNKIYSTDIDNPFVFSKERINTLGVGYIMKTTAATKAMSQGQFGQYPLYAFTTEGVWALDVNKEGEFVNKHPVTRDVCINPDSITQIDDAVLFCTDRGIMLLSGSESICISDTLNAEDVFSIDNLPRLSSLAGDLNVTMNAVPFKEFIKQAKMLYDYTHQRIIVYNPDYGYAYVYSLKSKQWGMMQSNIDSGLNSYPECLAVTKNNAVVNLSNEKERENTGEGEEAQALLITRPLKLDEPDILKTISTVIQRGKFRKGHVKSILYGSRDLFSWIPIWSSRCHILAQFRGTPYKYFRIVLLCNLDKDESIYGCTIEYQRRLIDKLR